MLRLALHLLWVLPAVVIAWWGLGRLTASARAVVIHRDASTSVEHVPPATSAETFTLGAYNIAHARGLADTNWIAQDQRQENLAALVAAMRDQADVMVLNEVDFAAAWSGSQNQAAFLGGALGYGYRVEQRSIDLDLPLFRLKFGNAVLSRFPIADAQPIALPHYKRWEAIAAGSKQACFADVQLPSGRTVRVIPIHLHTRSSATRHASVLALVKAAQASPHPVVLAGDFNDTLTGLPSAKHVAPGQTALEVLLEFGEQGFHTHLPDRPLRQQDMTFPSDRPKRVIDWIVVDPRLVIVDYRVDDTTASDHRPVYATIGFADSP